MNIKHQSHKRWIGYRLLLVAVILAMLVSPASSFTLAASLPPPPDPTEDIGLAEMVELGSVTASTGLATADAIDPHGVYAWPFTVVQMGHAIQSYQDYSNSPYFHHGIDMIAPNGTDVFNRSGGQVVNVENYQPGNDLYWEVAVKDPDGFIWQYHHIDKNTIPQAIKDKFAEYQANPTTGGFIPPNTYIGDIVYWTVTSFGYRFNHIHLNILAADGSYVNTMEFHSLLNDTQLPEIQAIGLLKSNTVTSGNTVSGDYGLYVRARDLFLSTVYYLPPYHIEFSLDGGAWTTVWKFENLPGGPSDTAYVTDFYVVPPTCGNYSCREFYIDLGFTKSGQRAFPSTPGNHTIQVRVWDYNGNSDTDSFTWTVYKTYENASASNITDNSCTAGTGVVKTFNVTDNFVISDVNIGLNITHATRGQLRVTLKAPGDASATTIVNTSTDAYDNYDVLVDDASTSAINDGSNDTVASPYYESDRRAGPSTNASLDAFTGKSSLGTWTMNICDGTSTTTGTVNRVKLDIAGVVNTNNPPTANPQSLTTAEDTALGITLSGSDPDGDPLTYSVTANPSHGTLSGSAPNLTYTPALNYTGADSFQFVANDGKVNSAAATVSLTVTAVNDAPVANPQSVATNEDTAVAITLSGSDVEGSPLTYTVTSAPAHGSLSGSAPNLTYTPALNYSGADSFQFQVSDGVLSSAAATVSLTVNPVNDAPVAVPQSLTTAEDAPLALTLSASDVEGSPLTFSITNPPLHGLLSGSAPNLTYTPALNYHGADSFQFVANDGAVSSAPATVDLTVTPLNDAPQADAQSVVTQQDVAVAIGLSGSDVEGDGLAFNLLSSPAHGALSGTAPDLTYTPEAGYVGDDSFTFEVNDGQLSSAPALVSITVTRINHQPLADAQALSTAEDAPLAITLTGSDPDSDPLTFRVVDGPTSGVLSGAAPDLLYTPAVDFNGADSFTFVTNDGLVDSAPATVSLTVTPLNDAPVANAQSVVVAEDASVAITLTGSDVDGDLLSFALLSVPAHGTLSGLAPDLVYTPAANYYGSDSFTFTVNDGSLDSAAAAVSITVSAVNDAPLANPQSVLTLEDAPLAITLSGSDLEGSPLSYTVLSAPAHGSLSGTAPNLTYTPAANYNGLDSFTFKVNDGAADSAPATVSITVLAVNDAPLANAQSLTTAQDTALAITLTGSDVEGSALTYSVVTSPAHGSLSGAAPSLTYTPASGYSGGDSFTFKVNDGELDSAAASVSITVTPSGPLTVFSDNFETSLGWTRNPSGTDTATLGVWERANPEITTSSGTKQMGTTVSGSYDLVTGPLAGNNAGSYDIDGGATTIRSPNIVLPAGRTLTLTLKYYLAHGNNSSTADYLRIKIVGATTTTVLQELAATNDDDAAWATLTANISSYAGQTVYILIEAADAGGASLVEAGVDDVVITAP